MSKDTTRDRILAAASEEFSLRGYEKTTVRDICTKADVNVAAINYHFRDKQNLFHEVLASWLEAFVVDTRMVELMESALTPEEKLREYIRAELGYTCQANDPDGLQLNRIRLLLQELTAEDHNPDIFKCHDSVEEKVIFPVIRELIGDKADDEALQNACMAATSQVIHYFLRALDDRRFTLRTRDDLEKTTDFMTTFALGGLNAIKENYNAR